MIYSCHTDPVNICDHVHYLTDFPNHLGSDMVNFTHGLISVFSKQGSIIFKHL